MIDVYGIGSGAVVFDAWYSSGGVLLHGLFTNIAGTLMKVLDNTESVAGKPLADFSFGSGGFGGARAVFTAVFQDGSQAVGVARVNDLKCSQDDGDEPASARARRRRSDSKAAIYPAGFDERRDFFLKSPG